MFDRYARRRAVLILALGAAALSAATAAPPAWEPLTTVDTAFTILLRPHLDAAGNAYAVGAPGTVLALSAGTSGAWLGPTPMPLDPGESTGVGSASVGPGGLVAVTYSAYVNGGPCELRLRLFSSAGWQGPFTVDADTCQGYANVDAQGRVAIAYAAYTSSGAKSPRGRVFDPATSTFGPVLALAPAGTQAAWLNLARNASGTWFAASWLDPSAGVRVSLYDAAGAAWSASHVLANSIRAANFNYLAAGQLPTAVDDAGDITVIVPLTTASGRTSVQAYRRNGGAWSRPQTLLPWGRFIQTLPNNIPSGSPNIAVNPAGEVLATIGHQAKGSADGVVSAFRFSPESGWSNETVATTPGILQTAEVAWLGSDGRAVVAYPDYPNTAGKVRAVVNDGTGWNLPVDLTSQVGSVAYWYLATAPAGDVLLMLCGDLASAQQGAYATWMRP